MLFVRNWILCNMYNNMWMICNTNKLVEQFWCFFSNDWTFFLIEHICFYLCESFIKKKIYGKHSPPHMHKDILNNWYLYTIRSLLCKILVRLALKQRASSSLQTMRRSIFLYFLFVCSQYIYLFVWAFIFIYTHILLFESISLRRFAFVSAEQKHINKGMKITHGWHDIAQRRPKGERNRCRLPLCVFTRLQWVCVCVYVCMYVHVHIWVYVYMYVRI